jgi:hypothetical protein
MSESGAEAPVRPVADNQFAGARALFPLHDFVGFHRCVLPDLCARNGHLVGDDIAGVEPVAFATSDAAFTYRPAVGGVEIVAGADGAATIVELAPEDFSDFVNEIHSASGLAMAAKLHFVRGGLAGLHRWEPTLRGLYHGRPIWTAGAAATLVDASGEGLDLTRTFRLEDADAELRAFLETAGFLHLRSVYTPEEVAALGAEVERARAALTPGTGDVWWSTTRAGEQVPTRINYLGRWSDAIRRHCDEPRLQRLGRLLGEHFRVCDDRLDGPMAFIKNSHVVQGLGDLQWHQDDGLGGHPVMCPLMQVGIQLDRADAENGQLWVLAGSHRYSKHPMAWGEEDGQPVVRIETEPGDVTVHYGDIFHTTPPPTGERAGRRVLYYKFAEPKTFDAIPAGAHYNDLLFKAGAGGRVATRAATWSEEDEQASFERARLGDRDASR